MFTARHAKTTFASIASLFLMTGVAFADTKVKSRQTSNGQTYENVSYIKGKRQRSETNNGQMVTIQQCDLRRNIQIMPQAQAYMIQPYDDAASTSTTTGRTTTTQSTAATKGGVVTSTVTSRDTGERKQMFGYTARHVITTMVMQSSPDSCSPVNTKMEFDGWYIDAAFALDCGNNNYGGYQPQASSSGCRDRYETKQLGNGKRGYPVWEKTTMYDANGNPSYSTINEVIEFSQATLDASLFDVPEGYREVKDYASLYSSAATQSYGASGSNNSSTTTPTTTTQPAKTAAPAVGPKKPGVIRVGLVTVRSSGVGEGINATELAASVQNSLTQNFKTTNLEVVGIEAQIGTQIESEARDKQCDYLVYTNVSHKKGGGGGFGSAFGGLASSVGGYGNSSSSSSSSSASTAGIKARDELTLDLRVEKPGAGYPLLTKQFKAKAKSAGEDIITPVSQQAVQAVAGVAVK